MLQLDVNRKPLFFSNPDHRFLWHVWMEIRLRQRQGNREPIDFQELCGQCFSPLQNMVCRSCRNELVRDYIPLLLSILFPGLGQLYLKEFGKGALAFLFGLVLIIWGVDAFIPFWAHYTTNTGGFDVVQQMQYAREAKRANQFIWFAIMFTIIYLANLLDIRESAWKRRSCM